MIRLALLLVALVLTAAPAFAEPASPDDENALASCGEDRACRQRVLRLRLEVSRLVSEANRIEQMKREVALTALDHERLERMRRAATPVREVRTVETDLFLSTSDLIGRGVLVGWGPSGSLRFEAFLDYSDTNYYGSIDGSSYGSTHAEGTLAGARVRWIPVVQGASALYVAGGPALLSVDVNSYSYSNDESGNQSSSQSSEIGIAHGLLTAIGVDFQLQLGVHAAVEVQYFVPWYVQALDATSRLENTGRKDQLSKMIKDNNLGAGFLLGWAW